MAGLLMVSLLVAFAGESYALARAEAELSADIGVHELRAHVYRLASIDFQGRRGAGAARTCRHLLAALQRLPLRPAFAESYEQPIPWPGGGAAGRPAGFIGRNVGAVLPGSDPALRDEWILLCAHYDHLGRSGDKWFPGADDDASGVAALLEIAEHFALSHEKPRRSIMFVFFDQEESGLLGSKHFASHPPRDLRDLKACLTADMLGRSMANVMDEYVFVLGSEKSTRLRELVAEVLPESGLRVGRIGIDLIGTRSDYGPFRDQRIPFLFFSTGVHPDYHKPTDVPERVDYVKLRKIAVWISDLAWRLANDAATPTWNEEGLPPDLNEVRTVLVLIDRVIERPEVMALSPEKQVALRGVRRRLEEIAGRGEVTAVERAWLLWSARLLMVTMF
jgi:hypothetical protein